MSDVNGPFAGYARIAVVALLIATGASLVPVAVRAASNAPAETVRGFFCNSKADQIAFLSKQARGENEEMAANAVNKSAARASCAYYMPLEAIAGSEETIIAGGLTFVVQKFVFLPEKSEHWAGAVLGSIPRAPKDSDI